MKKVFYFVGFVIVFGGCVGPKALERKINREQYPLGYLHDSPKSNEKYNISIVPDIIDNADSTFRTLVYKDYGRYLYLLFAYTYRYEMTVSLGKSSVSPGLADFVEVSFAKESERSGNYILNDTSVNVKYDVRIEISNYKVESKYFSSGGGAGSASSWQIDVKPSVGYLKMDVTLVDLINNEIVFGKEYMSNKTSNFVESRARSQYDINYGMMNNMSETLSQCIKENISDIVSDINDYISK